MTDDAPDEKVDTGFDAVIAGERFAPADEPAPGMDGSLPSGESEPSATPACTGAGPVTATVIRPEPDFEDEKSGQSLVTALTPEGVEAAKSLVQLPVISPSELARLAREIAMNIKERHVVLKDFKLSESQYEFLEKYNEFYVAALKAACIEWHAPLSTQERIKVEAAAILEDSLIGLGARLQNRAEGLPGVVEVAKLFAKIAGVGERETSQSTPGERFTINIDLGGDQRIVVASTPAPEPAPKQVAERPLQSDTET